MFEESARPPARVGVPPPLGGVRPPSGSRPLPQGGSPAGAAALPFEVAPGMLAPRRERIIVEL